MTADLVQADARSNRGPNVAHWNRTFPKYPMTVSDKGWIYGVWYCGTGWTKVRLYGQYPPGFLKRALALFPGVDESRILQCPSGTLTGPGTTVDAIRDDVRVPQIVADAGKIPLPDETFDLVLSDPPYSKEDSAKYGMPTFPMKKFMAEAHRLLRPGGHLAVLDTKYPSYDRKKWRLVGLICVVTGFLRATRIFSIFEVQKPLMLPIGLNA